MEYLSFSRFVFALLLQYVVNTPADFVSFKAGRRTMTKDDVGKGVGM